MHGIFGEHKRALMAETHVAISQDDTLVKLAISLLCFCSKVFSCSCMALSQVGADKYDPGTVMGYIMTVSLICLFDAEASHWISA